MRREFRHLSKAWYGESVLNAKEDVVDEIIINIFDGGGSYGEFVISWKDLNNSDLISPRIEIFDDAWAAAFNNCYDIFSDLAKCDNSNPSPENICEILKSHGVVDVTEEDND